jgi:hypothetical protein
VLAASLQFRMLLPLEDQPQHAEPVELVLTPALELLITQKPNVIQVRPCSLTPAYWGCSSSHSYGI